MAAPCAPVPQSFVSPLAQVPQILLLSYTHLHATLSAKKDPFGQYFPCRKKKRTRGSQKSLPSKPQQLLLPLRTPRVLAAEGYYSLCQCQPQLTELHGDYTAPLFQNLDPLLHPHTKPDLSYPTQPVLTYPFVGESFSPLKPICKFWKR